MNDTQITQSVIRKARAARQRQSHALLTRLGFRRVPGHENALNGAVYVMPEYPGPKLVVDEPLLSVQEVITKVFAWGHACGTEEAERKIREALDIRERG